MLFFLFMQAADAAFVQKLHQTKVSEALHPPQDNKIKDIDENSPSTSSNNPSVEVESGVENEVIGEKNAGGGIKSIEESQNIFSFTGEKQNKDIKCSEAENDPQNLQSSIDEKDAHPLFSMRRFNGSRVKRFEKFKKRCT